MEIRDIRERNRIAERLAEISVPLDFFRAHVRGLTYRSDVSSHARRAREETLHVLEAEASTYQSALERFAAIR